MDNARKFWALQPKPITSRRLQPESQPVHLANRLLPNGPGLSPPCSRLPERVLPVLEQDLHCGLVYSNTAYDSRASTSPSSKRDQGKPPATDPASLLQHHFKVLPIHR